MNRRKFLGAASLLATSSVLGLSACGGGGEDTEPYAFGTGLESPSLAAPANACDSHMHIFNSAVASIAGAIPPDNASVAQYSRSIQSRLGTQRVVVTEPSNYGADNSVVLAAVAELGSSARGVACCTTATPDAELRSLTSKGIVGLRFYLNRPTITTVDMIAPLAARVASLNWHFTIILTGDQVVANEALFASLPIPIVLEHFAGLSALSDAGYAAVLRLLKNGKTYVKLTRAPALITSNGVKDFDYHARDALAQGFITAAPDRMLWGSDWPHPAELTQGNPAPDDAKVFDLLATWSPDAGTRQKILVDNPARLYGFA